MDEKSPCSDTKTQASDGVFLKRPSPRFSVLRPKRSIPATCCVNRSTLSGAITSSEEPPSSSPSEGNTRSVGNGRTYSKTTPLFVYVCPSTATSNVNFDSKISLLAGLVQMTVCGSTNDITVELTNPKEHDGNWL